MRIRIFPHFKLPAIKLPAVHPAVNVAGLATVVGNAAALALTPQGQAVMHGSMTTHDAQIASLVAGGVLAFLPAKQKPQSLDMSTLTKSVGEAHMENALQGLHIDLSSVTTGLEDALKFLAGSPVVVPVKPQQIKLAGYDVQVSLGQDSIAIQYLGKVESAPAAHTNGAAEVAPAVTAAVEAAKEAAAPNPHA